MIKYRYRLIGIALGVIFCIFFQMYLNRRFPTVAKASNFFEIVFFSFCFFIIGWSLDSMLEKRRWLAKARESSDKAIASAKLTHTSGLEIAKQNELCLLIYDAKGLWIHQKAHKSFITKEQIVLVKKKDGFVESGSTTYSKASGRHTTYPRYSSYYSLTICYISQSAQPKAIGFIGSKSEIENFELAINGRPEEKLQYEQESQAYHL